MPNLADRNEGYFSAIRVGNAAREALRHGVGPRMAVVSAFPCSVRVDDPTLSRAYWPLTLSCEPGGVFPEGVTPVEFSGNINGRKFSGVFCVVIADCPDPAAGSPVVDYGGPRPPWADQIAARYFAAPMSEAATVRRLQHLARLGAKASEAVIKDNMHLVYKVVAGMRRRMSMTGAVLDIDDAIAVGVKSMHLAVSQFSSAARPNCSFSRAVIMNAKRDINRAVAAALGEPENIFFLRGWLSMNPDVLLPDDDGLPPPPDLVYRRARERGLSGRYTQQMVEFVVANPRRHNVSLDEPTGPGENHRTLLEEIADVDADVESRVSWLSESLAGLLSAVGMSMQDAEPWLFSIGVLDGEVHTTREVEARYGDDGPKRARKAAERFFKPFIRPGESWRSDRETIQRRALSLLTEEGSLVSSGDMKRTVASLRGGAR